MGYTVLIGSPSSVNFTSAAVINIGNFTLYVADAGNNPLLSADLRHNEGYAVRFKGVTTAADAASKTPKQ